MPRQANLHLCIKPHPMGKNYQNRHTTVPFFMRSAPILTPTGVKKRQFYDNFKNRIRFRYTTVATLSCLRLLGTDVALRIVPTLFNDRFRYTPDIVAFTPVVNKIGCRLT